MRNCKSCIYDTSHASTNCLKLTYDLFTSCRCLMQQLLINDISICLTYVTIILVLDLNQCSTIERFNLMLNALSYDNLISFSSNDNGPISSLCLKLYTATFLHEIAEPKISFLCLDFHSFSFVSRSRTFNER